MSFAVVGLAMVYSHGQDMRAALRAAGLDVPGLVTDAGDGTASAIPAAAAAAMISVPRPDPGVWMGLDSLPGQAEIAFDLPRDMALLAGALELAFDSQLAGGSSGLMTLSVNGTSRGQVLLEAG